MDFYRTKRWRQLRRTVIGMFENKCMKCSCTNRELQVDHVYPRSKYPELEYEITNLQVLCKNCNEYKGNYTCADYRTEQQRLLLEEYKYTKIIEQTLVPKPKRKRTRSRAKGKPTPGAYKKISNRERREFFEAVELLSNRPNELRLFLKEQRDKIGSAIVDGIYRHPRYKLTLAE